MKSTAIPEWQADYADAALRCYQDGDTLFQRQRYPNATHLFGLAAECALKLLLEKIPGMQEIPHKHLPELRDDVLRMLSGRGNNGVRQLLNMEDYMVDWKIANRYWPRQAFSLSSCKTYRDHSRRTLHAVGIRGRL
ncbi:MAG: hypothetical protein LGR52_05655 [Candidatus Thiosymbion ectosymbiont of Robbea hypermnestra]|nr:hypothetical protein [Candidatus Thiosymbion ectosymbiont of Robbea hypermnestra]